MKYALALLLLCTPAFASDTQTTIPNNRELTAENYQLLGRLVWDKLQKSPDLQKPDYSTDDIGNLIDTMRRNRDELNLTLEELMPLLENSCPRNSIPGVQVESVAKWFK